MKLPNTAVSYLATLSTILLLVFSQIVASLEAKIISKKTVYTDEEKVEFDYGVSNAKSDDQWAITIVEEVASDQLIDGGYFNDQIPSKGKHSFEALPPGKYELRVVYLAPPPADFSVLARDKLTIVTSKLLNACQNFNPEFKFITLVDYAEMLLASRSPTADELILSVALAQKLYLSHAYLARRLLNHADAQMKIHITTNAVHGLQVGGAALSDVDALLHLAKTTVWKMAQMSQIHLDLITWDRSLETLIASRPFLKLILGEKNTHARHLVTTINTYSEYSAMGMVGVFAVSVAAAGTIMAGPQVAARCVTFAMMNPRLTVAMTELVVGTIFSMANEKYSFSEIPEHPEYLLDAAPDVIIFIVTHGKIRYRYKIRAKRIGQGVKTSKYKVVDIEKTELASSCGTPIVTEPSKGLVVIGGAASGEPPVQYRDGNYPERYILFLPDDEGAGQSAGHNLAHTNAVLNAHFRRVAEIAKININDDIPIEIHGVAGPTSGSGMSADAYYLRLQGFKQGTDMDVPMLVWDIDKPDTRKALRRAGVPFSEVHSIVVNGKIQIKVNNRKEWGPEKTADSLAHELHEIERWREFFAKDDVHFATRADVNDLASAKGVYHIEANQAGGTAVMNLRVATLGAEETASLYTQSVEHGFQPCLSDSTKSLVVFESEELSRFYQQVRDRILRLR